MITSIVDKLRILEDEYPVLYEGVKTSTSSHHKGRFPPFFGGMTLERIEAWGVEELSTNVDKILERIYDDLSNLGRFGEDSRNENIILQDILRGEKNFKTADLGSTKLFMVSYPTLVWALYVSATEEKQRHSIRMLVLSEGTSSEIAYVLEGVKKLPRYVLRSVKSVAVAKQVFALSHINNIGDIIITHDNIYSTLYHNPWMIFFSMASGTFLVNELLRGSILDLLLDIIGESKYYMETQNTINLTYMNKYIRVLNTALRIGIITFTNDSKNSLNRLLGILQGIYKHTIKGELIDASYWQHYNVDKDPTLCIGIDFDARDRFEDSFVANNPDFDYGRIFSEVPSFDEEIIPYIANRYTTPEDRNQAILKSVWNSADYDLVRFADPTINNDTEWAMIVLFCSPLRANKAMRLRSVSTSDMLSALERIWNNSEYDGLTEDTKIRYIGQSVNISNVLTTMVRIFAKNPPHTDSDIEFLEKFTRFEVSFFNGKSLTRYIDFIKSLRDNTDV